MSKKPSTAPFVDPETAARMQSLREQDEFAPQPDETLTQVGRLSQENLELKQKLGEATEVSNSLFRDIELVRKERDAAKDERDMAVAQVAILKANTNPGQKAIISPVRLDGSRVISLTIDPDKAALWESWAQDYGTSFDEMAVRQISEALDAYAG